MWIELEELSFSVEIKSRSFRFLESSAHGKWTENQFYIERPLSHQSVQFLAFFSKASIFSCIAFISLLEPSLELQSSPSQLVLPALVFFSSLSS